MATTKPSFEASLQSLEQAVQKLESGELDLEQALEQFELGIKLGNHCQSVLQKTEQKVQQLINDKLTPFEANIDESSD